MTAYDPKTMAHKDGWRARFEADLAAQLADGGTMYGLDARGQYIARTKDGVRVVKPGTRGTEQG